MTIKVYNLNRSRSHRIVWLLEEINLPYELVKTERDLKTNRAGQEACAIHPLGKFPIIQDGEFTLAESGAIVEYLVQKYGKGRLAPAVESPEYPNYLFWMHYAEGSFSLPLMMRLFQKRMQLESAPYQAFVDGELKTHLEFIDKHLQKNRYFLGDELSGADFMMGFDLDFSNTLQLLDAYEHIKSYLNRIWSRPAYAKAASDSSYGITDKNIQALKKP